MNPDMHPALAGFYRKTTGFLKDDMDRTLLDYHKAKEGVTSLYHQRNVVIDALVSRLGAGTQHLIGYVDNAVHNSFQGFQPDNAGNTLNHQLLLAYANSAPTPNAVNLSGSYR